MNLILTREKLENLNEALQWEWIETNGLGGWAGSTVHGCHTRRYHGMLMAAVQPPAGRMLTVSRLDETLCLHNGQAYPLSVKEYDGFLDAGGSAFLQQFSRGLFPEWIYQAGNVKLAKTVTMRQQTNCTLVKYQLLEAPAAVTLQLRPFAAMRGYHALARQNQQLSWSFEFDQHCLRWKPYADQPELLMNIPGSRFVAAPDWYYHFAYRLEKYRGLDADEDLATPGYFEVEMAPGDTLYVALAAGSLPENTGAEAWQQETLRKQELIGHLPEADSIRQLALAADQFIVNRDGDLKTIIAGYHWFTDWGRDSMISLPGLCLNTGRYDDAKKILSAFANSVSMGMLPNRFQDNAAAPEYNNVDGTLWYFIAIYRYWLATGDDAFVLNRLLPVLKSIIDWHFRGTRYNIKVQADGLLFAGEQGQQLTWMDARIGNWVVTPRMGKPVEVQALWYNALCIFALLLRKNGQPDDAALVEYSAAKTKSGFESRFWNAAGGYLYDVIDENDIPDAQFRPNQLLAISLPFPLLTGKKAEQVLEKVTDKLLTPAGLRSLSPDDKSYVGIYGGNAFQRDSAYHQGTVWTWLAGPYIDALMRVHPENGLPAARNIYRQFLGQLQESGMGTVSEIADANAPHRGRGCMAQAWSVAELLRVGMEYPLLPLNHANTSDARPLFVA